MQEDLRQVVPMLRVGQLQDEDRRSSMHCEVCGQEGVLRAKVSNEESGNNGNHGGVLFLCLISRPVRRRFDEPSQQVWRRSLFYVAVAKLYLILNDFF